MSSSKREAQEKGFTIPAITKSKRGSRPDCSPDCSFECVAPHARFVSRGSRTNLPAFKREALPFQTLSVRALSPQQNDRSVIKLPQLVSKVGNELAVRESMWNEGPCFVASALSADTPVKTLQHSSVRNLNVDHKKPAVPQEKTRTKKKSNLRSKPLTGTEVSEILAKKKHLGEHEFYYLKASEDGPYRPYDLHVVPHSSVGSDYYTFTPTTVIHVQDGCSVELWTLACWYKESLLWETVRNIPFFRDFLLRRTFKRWHRNVHIATVKRRTDSLPSQLLTSVPQFRDALLQLSRLIEEIKQVIWLPQDDSRTYTLLDFQTALLKKNQTAKVSLNHFLHCRAAILNMVKEKSYQAQQELQMEVERSKLNQSGQSLNFQLTHLRNLQKELSQAEQALQRLGNLAALADCMIVQNLVTISKQAVKNFLNNVLKRDQEQQVGLFQVEIVFGADGQLTASPPLHLFPEVLFAALLTVADSVLQVFDSCSLSCDSKIRPPSSCVFISDAQDFTAGTSRACISTDTADKGCEVAGAGGVFSQKECKMSPQTIVPVRMKSLRVQAQRVRGHYQPLPRRQLEWHLNVHTEIQEIQNEQAKITQEAITEVYQLCEDHSWLTDVRFFTNQWSSASLEALRGCSSLKYEELIKKLHLWMDGVHSMPPSFTTSNKLFTVKISNIKEDISSILSNIDEDVLKLLCEDLQSRSENLASELRRAVEVMKSEPNTFHNFTVFSNMVKHSVKMSDDLKQRLEDLHSLQETVQRNYTHMAPDEVFLTNQRTDLWSQFILLLKRAPDIVSQQLPSMVNTLDSNFSSLVTKLDNLVSRASSEPYLDPDQNAKEMLIQLNALCSQFYMIAEQLNNLSRASECLKGHLLDLTFVTVAQRTIEARKGLWELMSVSSTQIQEWKFQKFNKVVVANAQNKISEWLQQAEIFARVIPSSDAVLQKILQILQGFSQRFPILSELSSTTLNHKHWRNISKEIGLLYDPERKLTLADLMSIELLEQQSRINKVCMQAKAEADTEQTFRTLQKQWRGAVLRHNRFIVALSPLLDDAKGENSSSLSPLNAPEHHLRDGGTFTIVDLETLLGQTKKCVLTLSDMLHSLHIADFQREVEHWLQVLQELDELLDLFERCQDKWIFLSKMFNETSANTEQFKLKEKFQPVDKMFREIIEITVNDPHVLSFVQMKLTSEASQSFQGQSLRTVLMNGHATMEEISSQLLYVLESPRSQFPRLYFLSDGEVMKLLSLQLPTPSSLLPLVQKCFREVRWLDVHGKSDVSHEHHLTDLSNELMWVHGVYGAYGEHVPFLCPLESNLNPVAWLSLFEQKLQQAIKQTILKCIDIQQCSELEEHEDTRTLIGNNKGNSSEVAHEPPSLLELTSLYPLQCLLVAEEVLWCTVVQKSFHNPTAAMLAPIKSRNTTKLNYLCQLIKVHSADSNKTSAASPRIMNALRALVMLTMKHSQQTDGLVEVKVNLESSFEWHKLMKYYLSPSATLAQCDLHPPQEDSACVNQSVYVDILCKQFSYGYEYIGPENWMMVTTPSTVKAYMGIILALSSYKCAFISGPHMSGKQQVAVQLGYALGRQVVSMKCCCSTGSSLVSQMLLGALQTGAWLVLDSVDSMEQGTLSELGHHLADIHQHLSAVQKHSQHEGHESQHDVLSKVSPSESIKTHSNTVNEVECHIAGKNILARLSYGCITISANGYSAELPENLRVAIRPVSFMQPHYKMIAEVMLVSLGFSEAATISRRLVSLFSIAKDSHCLPDWVSGHKTSWLVLLKNVIAASGTHLHHSYHLEETNKGTLSRQNGSRSVTTPLDPLETIPEKVKDCYSSIFRSVNQSNAIINAELEEYASIKGVLSVMQYTVSDPKRAEQFHTIFEEIFPKAKFFTGPQQFIDERQQNILKNTVKEELQQRGLYEDPQMLLNVLILYQALKLSNVVLLVGPAGSGKTTLNQILASALQKLSKALGNESDDLQGDFTDIHHHSSMPCWTSVSTEVIFPNAFSHKEFFGGYSDQIISWFDGAFTKALRHSEHLLPIAPSESKKKTVQIQSVKWIVLDGDPFGKPAWLDSLSSLCNLENPCLCLSSGEKIQPSRGTLKILSEITDLGDSTPSVVTQCSLVYVSGENLWKAVWKSEMDMLSSKQNVDSITLKMWSHLAEDLFPETLTFFRNKALSSVMAGVGSEGKQSSRITDGVQEVMSFIRILHVLLEHFGKGGGSKYTSRQTEKTDNSALKLHSFDSMASSTEWGLQARNLFVVAYIWGFGGYLHPRHWPQFDLFARETLYKSHCKIETPPEGTIFEHFFEFSDQMGETTNFINCTKRMSPQFFTPVSQYEKHAYLLDMLLDAHQPALLVGETGSGKTMLCKSLISQARPHMHLPASPGLRPSDLHKAFERVRYQTTQLSNTEVVLKQPDFLMFIDDLHEAPFDACGKTSMTLEMLRQSISKGEVLASDGTHFKLFQSKAVYYLGTCCAPHLGNSNQISPRLFRLFTLLALPSMTLEILFSMHSQKLQSWLKAIQPMKSVADMANCIITSTADVYFAVHQRFTTASHSLNRIYSLHDIHKVFQGMCLWRPRLNAQKHLQSGAVCGSVAHELNITRLWMHECLRTFGDRLDSTEACQELISVLERNFGTRLCPDFQTDLSTPTDQLSATSTCNLNQQVLSTPFQVEENDLPLLGMVEVQSEQTEQVESNVLEINSSLCSPGSDENAFSYSKDKLKEDENIKSEPATVECKYESAIESSTLKASCSELFTEHVPLTSCENTSSKTINQLLQEIASSIQNVVFGPELCEPLNNVLHHFKRNSVYQERDVDVLIDQLVRATTSREEQFDNNYYSPRWAVHHQNVYQLMHILRAFLIPGGHGALFGATKKTGRKTMVRLAVTLLGLELIEVYSANEAKLREMLKEVGSRIGMDGGHLVLLVHEDTSQAVKDELLLMMANGTLPGLYSDQEVKKVILKMKSWMKNTHCQLKDDQVLEMYFKNIQRNMHVFLLYPLLLNTKEIQPERSSVMEKHITKALSLCCCVEVCQPWTSEALAECALYHLKNSHHIPETNSTVAKDNLVASISQVMAEIHLSATKYAVAQLNFQAFSPRSYIELLAQFFSLCHHLSDQNRVQDNRLAKVFANVKGMTDTAIRHTQEVLSLRAKCEEKQKSLEQLQSSLDSAHKFWEQTRHHSLLEENWLSHLENQSHEVQQHIQDAFQQVSPLFQAAMEALQALSQSDLDEMRHYRTPPDGVVTVMDVICMLFNRPCGWENSRQLLMQPSFFEELEFFDCSKLSDEMIKTLGQIVQAPSFQPSFVRDVSRACESLCRWLGAVYQYACVQRHTAPQKAQKRDLDELMAESRARLRVARLEEMSARERLEELENQQELNRQDMESLKLQLSTAEAHEGESSATVKLMDCYIEDWNSALKEAELANLNIPGDALILAATITYLGPFRPEVRQALLQKWHKLCLTGVINMKPVDPHTVVDDVSLTTSDNYVPIPVSKAFQIALNRVLGLDLSLIHEDYSDLVRNVLLWGVDGVQRCPVLADVYQHEELKSQTLFPAEGEEKCHKEYKYGLIVSADDPELLGKLNHGAEEGLRVLVTHIERATANIKILQAFVQTEGSRFPGRSRTVKAAHPEFRLFMSSPLPLPALINEIPPSFLDEVQIINLSLSTTEVQDLLLTELMKSESSKLWTLQCQVQTEKQTLQHKLYQNKVSLMEYVMHSTRPLLQDTEFLPLVYTCQSVSFKLGTEIKELSQEIDRHKSVMSEFYPVAELATALYDALQEVAQLSSCYLFTLRRFLLTLRSALSKRSPDISVPGQMVPRAVVAEMTYRIVSDFFSQYKPCLFQSHAVLLRLLVSVALIVHNEGCSEAERVMFIRGLSHWKSSEHFLSSSAQSAPKLPSWIQTRAQADVYLLETFAPFRALASSLRNSSELWQEYLRFPSSTVIGPVPCQSHSHLSTLQRAVLWKTLCPHWLAAVEEDLAACAQGHMLHPVVATGPPMGSPEELSQLLSKNIGPVIVQLPNKSDDAHASVHPLHLIKQAAQYQAHKKGVRVTVISFGSGCHRDALLSALDSAVQNGHWLVLNNCHFLEHWDVTVVDKLTQIVSCTIKGHVTDVDQLLLNCESAGQIVHPHFRLWLITKGDKPHSVPAALRISALHLVCDSSWDLKDEMWSSVRQTLSVANAFCPPAHTEATVRPLLQCAILHSVLMQRQACKHLGQGQLYLWTHEDLLALIDAHMHITKHCSDPTGALEYIAGHLVYGGHVSDHADLEAVQCVVRVCLRQPSASWGRGPHNLSDVITFTGSFDAGCLLKGLSHRIKGITDSNDPIILGFSPGMAGELMKLKSHTLNILLHQSQSIYGDIRGETILTMQELPEYKQAWERLLTLQDKLRKKKTDIGVEMGSAYLGPLRHFLQAEWKHLDKLVSSLLLDDFQPVAHKTSSTPAYLTSAALSRLETQADLLGSYLWEESSSISPHAYQLAAFVNPQGFLVALIRDMAHIQKKDISILSLHFKVLKDTVSPSAPSRNGVCLCGLQLQGALWDPGSGVLKDALSPIPSYFPPLWVSVEERKDGFSPDSSLHDSPSLPLYYCPLYVDRQTADGYQHLSADNIVAHVPLATRDSAVVCRILGPLKARELKTTE